MSTEELQNELNACRQVNAFLMVKFKEITTEMKLAEMIGLGKDTGTDVAMCHIATEFIELKKENKKLQDTLDQINLLLK